jgi:RNA polymerase sigma factor (sigma-70 family)
MNEIKYLWESFVNGDDKSFSSIYEIFISQLISYGHKLCADHSLVHDCIQELFIDLFLKREKLNVDIKNPQAYLFISLRNSIIRKIKANKKIELIEISEKQDVIDFNIEFSCQDKIIEEEVSYELKKILNEAIRKIPPKQKEIIYLKFETEMSYTEIAQIMNISIESARKLFYRSMLSLREVIDAKHINPIFFIFFLKFS